MIYPDKIDRHSTQLRPTSSEIDALINSPYIEKVQQGLLQ